MRRTNVRHNIPIGIGAFPCLPWFVQVPALIERDFNWWRYPSVCLSPEQTLFLETEQFTVTITLQPSLSGNSFWTFAITKRVFRAYFLRYFSPQLVWNRYLNNYKLDTSAVQDQSMNLIINSNRPLFDGLVLLMWICIYFYFFSWEGPPVQDSPYLTHWKN